MRTNELTAFASKRMRGAVTPAASLVLAMLLLTWGLALASRAVSLLIAALLSADAYTELYQTWLPILFGVLANILLVFPLWISIRRWIWRLDEDIRPLRTAFYYLSSPRRYIKVLWFSLVCTAVSFTVLLACFFPAAVVWAAVSVMQVADVWTVIAVILDLLLLLLGGFFAGYFLFGMFLSHYCFIAGYTENPFKAIALSFTVMRGNRARLFSLFFNLIGYFLISLAVISLPLTVPHIESCFAVLAKELFTERIVPGVHFHNKENSEYVFTE